MILNRRRLLFMAPAIVAAPSLMKLSTALLEPFSTDKLVWRIVPSKLIVAPELERATRLMLDYHRFREIVEPAVREHFNSVYLTHTYGSVLGAIPKIPHTKELKWDIGDDLEEPHDRHRQDLPIGKREAR